MDNRSYLAILASGALFAGGVAGCDAGDPGDPGTPEPESSAMYDTEETDRATDTMADRQMEAEDRMQQAQQRAEQPQQDPSFAYPQDSAAGAGSLETLGDSEIVGKTVVSQDGEEIGEIDEVLTDPNTQQQVAVIDVGGFLGIGEKSVAVALDELQLSDDGRVRSDLTRETLQSQPEHDPTQFGKAPDPMQ
jgi:hypothetical protein